MSLHDWLGRHVADLRTSHWDRGHFVSRCTVCSAPMIKLPGLPWKILGAAR
ncbi:MAG: hypothetical protein QOG84_554 [Sphingomonadales bacterium]|nr:hypothetical protein [Sphingomonadales bacterium]MEA3048718.1 hypothetical protein [Sphingomonadales bacterium]